jgi:hypothetical protein
MKPQFGTSALLLATAFAAICASGMLPYWRESTPHDWAYLGWLLPLMTPILFPFLFLAYALGRRALTAKIVLAFAISEAAAVGVFWAWK